MWRLNHNITVTKGKISTHTSRVGCDYAPTAIRECEEFLLTHPVWDVTYQQHNRKRTWKFLLTHPVWDVTEASQAVSYLNEISTHTSRVGCDISLHISSSIYVYFYSHIPCGMWQQHGDNHQTGYIYFYSHIPCGMWPYHIQQISATQTFLLTHPVWDVTELAGIDDEPQFISTHTSRVGCDEFLQDCILMDKISTHTSRVGCDLTLPLLVLWAWISTHTSRVGCDISAIIPY